MRERRLTEMAGSTVFLSLSIDELRGIFREVLKEELGFKKEKELLSFKEACEFLSCSSSALNKWKSENKIPFKRLGKRIYFSRSEITDALEEAGNYEKLKALE